MGKVVDPDVGDLVSRPDSSTYDVTLGNSLNYLSLSFFIYKMRLIVLYLIYSQNYCDVHEISVKISKLYGSIIIASFYLE